MSLNVIKWQNKENMKTIKPFSEWVIKCVFNLCKNGVQQSLPFNHMIFIHHHIPIFTIFVAYLSTFTELNHIFVCNCFPLVCTTIQMNRSLDEWTSKNHFVEFAFWIIYGKKQLVLVEYRNASISNLFICTVWDHWIFRTVHTQYKRSPSLYISMYKYTTPSIYLSIYLSIYIRTCV